VNPAKPHVGARCTWGRGEIAENKMGGLYVASEKVFLSVGTRKALQRIKENNRRVG